jgi:hypothetical protein
MNIQPQATAPIHNLGPVEEQLDILKDVFQQQLNLLQHKIDEQVNVVLSEKNAWEFQKQLMIRQTFTSNQLISLNVGGEFSTVSVDTLLCVLPESHLDQSNTNTCESLFSAMFSGRFDLQRDDQNRVFIDRDPKHFRYILNYLRTKGDITLFHVPLDNYDLVKELALEAAFYNLVALQEYLEINLNFGPSTLLISRYTNVLSNWLPQGRWNLQYKASRDGFKGPDFHRMCDHKGDTLTIILTDNGSLFGGYTPIPWKSEGNYKWDSSVKTFIFSLKNQKGSAPTMMPNTGPKCNNQFSVHHSSAGPTFGGGHDIFISDNSNQNTNSYTNLNHSFQGKLVYGSDHAKQYLCGSYNFKVKEIEVFTRKN